MATILSILVALSYILLNVPYSHEYIDHQIRTHQQEIDAFQNDQTKMNQLKIYQYKQDENGWIVVLDNMDEM